LITIMEIGHEHEAKKEELFDAILAEVGRIVLSFPASDANVRVTDRLGSQFIDGVYYGWSEIEVTEPRELDALTVSRKVQSRRLMPGFEYAERPAFEFVLENYVPEPGEAVDELALFDLPGDEIGPNGLPTRDGWLLNGDRRVFYSRYEAPPSFEAFRLKELAALQTEESEYLEALRHEHLDERTGMYRHDASGTTTADFTEYLELLIQDWYKELQDDANNDLDAEEVEVCMDLDIEQREALLAKLKGWAGDFEAIFGMAKNNKQD
jgi:hypothetical protein